MSIDQAEHWSDRFDEGMRELALRINRNRTTAAGLGLTYDDTEDRKEFLALQDEYHAIAYLKGTVHFPWCRCRYCPTPASPA
jgi:hypothetical protein